MKSLNSQCTNGLAILSFLEWLKEKNISLNTEKQPDELLLEFLNIDLDKLVPEQETVA